MVRGQWHTVERAAAVDAPGGMAAVSEVGVLGDPTTATAEEGERIFAEMVDSCVQRVARWVPGIDGMLR
ncbi:creatinine amidohydrolase family protein [Mycobacterium xenopi 4042]|uniref:Creatinine amidohydrolase family protein n=1 Tax=Mycobacterium xenopi 4042 TaxID=1299334 RepID=X7YIH9_MYCXE|nr:creatinine amidohydrolase family protein [Mycobacterium xenopi 4042]